jgi:hypothetical protein
VLGQLGRQQALIAEKPVFCTGKTRAVGVRAAVAPPPPPHQPSSAS